LEGLTQNMNPKVLIIGAGSSGTRFAEIFLNKNFDVYFFKHRKNLKIPKNYFSAYDLDNLSQYKLAVIASNTNTHFYYLKEVIEKSEIPILIEKPLVSNLDQLNQLEKLINKHQNLIAVGFNLRQLPIIQTIKEYLNKKKLGAIYYADIYVDQYLPDWRPNKDYKVNGEAREGALGYRDNYSAHYDQGGGVALDLIHEIDLALSWFPNVNLKCLRSAKLSDLEIDTEDYVHLVTDSVPYINIKLGYLNRQKTRQYKIVGSKGTIFCDIFNQKFEFYSKNKTELIKNTAFFDIKQTYTAEVDHFLKTINHKHKVNREAREGALGQKIKTSDKLLGIDALKIALKARKHV